MVSLIYNYLILQVCELHFTDSDYEKESYAFDSKTGKHVSVPLKVKRLKSTAVPSVFPNYPGSSKSETEKARKSPETMKLEKEMTHLETAASESIKSF